jgi:hypothetical protein
MRPRFEEIEKRFPNIESKVYDIDFDEEAQKYNVGNILPVFIIFDNDDNELGRLIGEQKTEVLIKMVEDHL